MLGSQEIIDRLDGIKGLNGHFHKNGDPVRHRTVPETGQLQCLNVPALL